MGVTGKPNPPAAYERDRTDNHSEFGTLLTQEEVVDRLRGQVSLGTLRNWRCQPGADGPPWIKAGRGILYPEILFDRWLYERLRAYQAK